MLPSVGEHSPATPSFYGLVVPLKNHQRLTVTELVVSLKTTVLAATAATAGERARRRLVGAPAMKARSPVKIMDVCDVKVIDEGGFLAGNMMKSTITKERIWINRAASELCFCLYIRTLALCCTREEPNLHLEFCLRDVTDGMRSLWKVPVLVVSRSFQELNTFRVKLRTQCSLLLGCVTFSSTVKNVHHEAG